MVDDSRVSPASCELRLHIGILAKQSEDEQRVRSAVESAGWTCEVLESAASPNESERRLDLLVICARRISADVLASVTEAALDPRIPVLVIGRDRDPQHLADVLRSGAADYLVAPFASEEFIARVCALVTRSHHLSERRTESEIVFDYFTRTVVAGPMQMSLSQREWDALIVLLERESELVTVEALSESLTGEPDNETIVISTISRLRKKLRSNRFYAISLDTVYGHGYVVRFRRAFDTFGKVRKII